MKDQVARNRELHEKWKAGGYARARDTLITENLPLVKWWVSRNPAPHTVDPEDHYAAAVHGLIKAIDRWNPDASSLATYAPLWMRREVGREARVNQPTPVPQKVHDAIHRVTGALRESPGMQAEELAEVLDISPGFVEGAILARQDLRSLDAPLPGGEDDDGTLLTVIADTPDIDHYEAIDRAESRQSLVAYLRSRVGEEGAALLEAAYLSDRDHQEIAGDLGVPRETVVRRLGRVRAAVRGTPGAREELIAAAA